MWQSLYDSLEHEKCTDTDSPMPVTCSDATLDECEAALAFRLPTSYRLFMKTFGPGEIFDYYKIFGPGFPPAHSSRDHLDLTARVERRKKIGGWNFKNYDDPALAARMITFSSTLDGHDFGWDPLEKPIETEFGSESSIYAVRKEGDDMPRVAKTFKEFIVDFCQNGRDFECFGGNPSWIPEKKFRPFCASFT